MCNDLLDHCSIHELRLFQSVYHNYPAILIWKSGFRISQKDRTGETSLKQEVIEGRSTSNKYSVLSFNPDV